ncbi:MAG: polysaccharide biosynthesis protein, partial [Paracoccaceae bacterium]|nr:polysaccharide biosynthesis protein [Paracoccaceae bacterium]
MSGLAAVVSTALHLPNLKLNAFETRAILRTGCFAALVMAGLFLLIRQTHTAFPVSGAILFGLIFFLLSVAARLAMLHALLWVLRAGQARCRVVIYGAGRTGMQLAAALQMHDSIFPVAFVDDDPALHSMTVGGLRIFAADSIGSLAQDMKLNRVILAMPSVSAPKRARIARKLRARGLTVMALPSFAQLVGMETPVDRLTPVSAGQFLGRCQIDDPLPEGAESYQGQTVLVSGAGGSIGAELCRQLLPNRPKRIVLFEMSEIALYTIERELRTLAEGTEIEIVAVLGSVTDARVTRVVMEENRVDVVFHAAAYKHVPMIEANPIAGLSNNVLGTRTVAEAARDAGVKQFVLISTDKAVRPTNVMGASKRLAELVVQDMAKRPKDTMFSMARFGNVLGSSGSVIPLFKDQIA